MAHSPEVEILLKAVANLGSPELEQIFRGLWEVHCSAEWKQWDRLIVHRDRRRPDGRKRIKLERVLSEKTVVR